jgi:hypothetical protein
MIVTAIPKAYRVSLFENAHLSTALEDRVLVTKGGVVLAGSGSASSGRDGGGVVQTSRASSGSRAGSVESIINLSTKARSSAARSTTSQALVASSETRLSAETTSVGVLAIILVGRRVQS